MRARYSRQNLCGGRGSSPLSGRPPLRARTTLLAYMCSSGKTKPAGRTMRAISRFRLLGFLVPAGHDAHSPSAKVALSKALGRSPSKNRYNARRFVVGKRNVWFRSHRYPCRSDWNADCRPAIRWRCPDHVQCPKRSRCSPLGAKPGRGTGRGRESRQ